MHGRRNFTESVWRLFVPAKPLSRSEATQTARAIAKFKGDRRLAAKHLGFTYSTVNARVQIIRAAFPDIIIVTPEKRPNTHPTKPQDVQDAVEAYKAAGTIGGAARALGIPAPTLRNRLQVAEREGFKPKGRVAAQRARALPLPDGDAIQRYILTAAQSDTKVHEPTWSALQALAAHYGATLMVSTFSYVHRSEGSAKRGTDIATDRGMYDPRIEPFVADEMLQLAPGLVWNGHMNLLPTAVDPLSGFDSYNGRASGVFPHAKVAMKSIPTIGKDAAKLQYTTGACTQINYLQKKAGQKAEFHHVYGGLVVEVNSSGEWWVRQLHTDSKGRIYDLDLVAMPNFIADPDVDNQWTVAPALPPAAVVFGDIHVAQLGEEHFASMLVMVAQLKPDLIVAHDILDMESRGHHNRRDPHKMFELHARGRECVKAEVEGVGEALSDLAHYAKVLVVNSNHDRHLERWLKEADWRLDPVNAEFYVDCQRAYLGAVRAGKRFDALKWAVGAYSPVKGVKFLAPGESYVVCRDRSGGVELGLHGDLGPDGSRGSIRNLSRLGRKVVIGHSHSAGIHDGAYQTGVSARLDMEYARGAPSAWSHTDCLIYANGKRALLTWWKGKWRA